MEVEGVKEWEVEKILNKRKIRGMSSSQMVDLVFLYFILIFILFPYFSIL